MKKYIILGLSLLIPSVVFGAQAFPRDLHFGMYGNRDVAALQDFLRAQGYLSLPATGNYLNRTIQAVKKFQQAHGLQPIGGYFGAESRHVANEILAAQQAMKMEHGTAVTSSGSSAKGTATTSPYKGKIFFDGVQASGDAQTESIIVSNRTDDERISITAFSITTEHGQNYVIPLGFALPGFSATPSDPIVLRPHDRVVISVGKQDSHINFRENMCTGYLDETAQFSPGLSHRCPVPDTRMLHNLSDRCIQELAGIPGCRTGPLPEFPDPDPACAYYIADNLNYVGCVANYKSRRDFYNDQWLVWMQRTVPFFNTRFETVVLKDQQGKVIDEYRYNNY